jgi:ADP-heptose:LPS heptosyltransferase
MRKAIRSTRAVWLQAALMLQSDRPETRLYLVDSMLIDPLDLVITVCTSVAHLAAALGKPRWILLDANPHWVWQLERTDSPWYPTATLYRQKQFSKWEPVMDDVVRDLSALAAAHKGTAARRRAPRKAAE